MQYFKWVSEDKKYFVEKFVGCITAEMIQLTEEHFIEIGSSKSIVLITDESESELKLNTTEAYELGRNTSRKIPVGISAKIGILLKVDTSNDPIVTSYVKGLDSSKSIEIKYSENIDDILIWANVEADNKKIIIEKVSQWSHGKQ